MQARGKRKFETGRESSDTTIAPVRRKVVEVLGGNKKIKLLRADVATVSDPKTGKTQVAKIQTVTENKANLHYTRRHIITKGAKIRTELGEAVVTSRPGQDGVVNAVLLAQ